MARAAIAFKIMKQQVSEVSFPNQVTALRVRKVNMAQGLAYGSLLTLILFIIALIAGTILISFTELDMETALYLAASAITTTGKGLYSMSTIGDINTFAQFVCAGLMIVGRLEVIIVLMLLSPDFWHDLFARIDFRKIAAGRHPKL